MKTTYKAIALGVMAASLSLNAGAKVVGTLEAVKAPSAPVIDGKVDAAWDKAKALKIKLDKTPYKPSNGFNGITNTTATIKAMYDDRNIYFLIQWDDPTESLNRFPWVRQPDGSWKQLKNKDSTGHDNTYYEDKMAMLWNINYKPFEKKGCAATCHMAKDGKQMGIEDNSPGRKYTKDGETVDMWHWKGVRTNPVGQADDQYIDDSTGKGEWGRHGDVKTGGGYKDNKTEDGKLPAYVMANPDENAPVIFMDQAKPFTPDYNATKRIPGMMVSPFQGPRADITAKGVWKDGKWTVELTRPLVTTGEKADIQDVQFNDMKKTYSFGISIFDNTQINHTYHEGVAHMVFK